MPNAPQEATLPTHLTPAHRDSPGLQATSALLLGPLAAALIWFLPLEIDPTSQKVSAVVVFMIIYWVAEPIDHAVTALIGCYLFWALCSTKFSVAFSGFSSTAPWFIFGGMLIAEAASSSGLAKRLGYRVLYMTGTSYFKLLIGVTTLSFLLGPFIPSGIARIAIVAPLLIGVLTVLNQPKHGNVGKGVFLTLTVISLLVDKVLLAGPAAILTHGILKDQAGVEILWGKWVLAFLPVTLATIVASSVAARWLFPDSNGENQRGTQYLLNSIVELGPLTVKEKKTLLIVGVAFGLWATDFIHHLNPTIIALGAGLSLALPKIGVLDTNAIKKANFLIIIFSAGALSMATVLSRSDVFHALKAIFVQIAPLLSNSFLASILLYWGGILSHFIFPNNQSLLSTSLPLLLSVIETTSYNPAVLGLIWQFAGGGTLFAYQSTVLVVGYSYGYFNSRDLIKFGATMMIIEGVLIMIIVPLYWPLIGLDWIP